MTHHHDPHPPYHLPANQYPQLEEERQGTPQDFAQEFPALEDRPDDEVTETAEETTVVTEKPKDDLQDGTLDLQQGDESAAKSAPKQPSSSTSRRRRKKTSDAEAIRALLAARPPTPSLAHPPTPTRSTTPATLARAAALARVREQAVEQFIAMELRREKERKRKADYRARKRQEAKGVPPAPPGETEQMEPDTAEVDGTEHAPVDDEGPQFPISSTSLVQHVYQHLQHHSPQPQQSHGIDPQMMGRGDAPNSGRASSAPGGLGGGKVQVKVGDRIVAVSCVCGSWLRRRCSGQGKSECRRKRHITICVDGAARWRTRWRTMPQRHSCSAEVSAKLSVWLRFAAFGFEKRRAYGRLGRDMQGHGGTFGRS